MEDGKVSRGPGTCVFHVWALFWVFCTLKTVETASDLEVYEIAKENSSAAQATKDSPGFENIKTKAVYCFF